MPTPTPHEEYVQKEKEAREHRERMRANMLQNKEKFEKSLKLWLTTRTNRSKIPS